MNAAPFGLKNSRGMTLIEIMIVLAIVGLIVIGAMTRLTTPTQHLKSAVRQIGTLSKDLHTRARLGGKTYRIALDLKAEGAHEYWVESSTEKVMVLSEEKREELAKLTQIQRESMIKQPKFQAEERITRGRRQLPPPLKFTKVEYVNRQDPLIEGTAYIHFFPEGRVEEVALHISDGEQLNWTVATHPITGKTEVYSRAISLEQLRKR